MGIFETAIDLLEAAETVQMVSNQSKKKENQFASTEDLVPQSRTLRLGPMWV